MTRPILLLTLLPLAAYAQGDPMPGMAADPNLKIPPGRPFVEVAQTVAPDYTAQAHKAGLQGTAVVFLELTPDGRLENIHLRRGLGMGLDVQAVEIVKRWQFKPVNSRTAGAVTVNFELNNASPWFLDGSAIGVSRSNSPRPTVVSQPVLNEYVPPDNSLCSGQPGYVIVNLEIDAHGVPGNVRVGSTPNDTVSLGVVEAVGKWRFKPGTENNKARPAKGTIVLECRPGGAPAVQTPDTNTFRVGNGVTAPVPIFRPEPQYSEEARKAKLQGEATLAVVVDANGKISDIRVVKPLGFGLDEEAAAAVLQWRFRPATKDGIPVRVAAAIAVNFRLL